MANLKNYLAIDLEINSRKYKFFRISVTKDGSLIVSPQIKPIMEGSLKGHIDDIHISQHISGKNHIKIRNIKTKSYHIPSITQVANRKCKWYICINAKDKLPKDIFNLNNNKNNSYIEYYLLNLSTFPKEWFTIYIEISTKKEKNKPNKSLFSQRIYYKGFYIYISICSGVPETKTNKKRQDLKLGPRSIQQQ
jgi:hypothetical protein